MLRVLIVDDEYIMRQGLRYMIDWEKAGYVLVGEASNGNDAIQLVGELKPDIVISDIVMPVLDGVDFAAAMHQMYPDMQIIILSGYDNFEYVKQTLLNGAVDYILKPTLTPKGLLDVLSRAANRIEGKEDCILADVDDYESMLREYLIGNDPVMNPQLAECLTSSYYGLYAFHISKDKHYLERYKVICDKLEREMQELSLVFHLQALIHEEQVCILFGFEISQRSSLRIKLEKISSHIAAIYPDFFAVMSMSFSDQNLIKELYDECIVKNCEKGFYHEGKHFLMLELLPELPKEEKFNFTHYNRLLMSEQFKEALELLVDYCDKMLDEQMDVFRMKNQTKNLIFTFLDTLLMDDVKKQNLRYEFFGLIDDALYERDYRENLAEIFRQLEDFIVDAVKDDRIDKILEYIEKNYMENLTMESLADEFNYNYYYLSSYFNQQVKEGFSGYLNKVRIRKACEILNNKDIPVADVSSMVGYSEHSYFCRVFKKMTGITPSAWRRR